MNGPDHPPVDLLADHHEGLLSGDLAARVQEHAAGCAQCRGLLSGLDGVRAMLREEGSAPVTMPADVAARLDAGLARAAAERSAGVPSLTDRRTSSGLASSGPAPRIRRLLPGLVAASALVVATAIGVTIYQSGDGPDDSSAGDSAESGLSRDDAGAGEGDQPDAAPSATTPSESFEPSPDLRERARAIADGTAKPTALSQCARPKQAGIVSELTVNGEPVVIVVDRELQTFTLYDCAGTTRLQKSSY